MTGDVDLFLIHPHDVLNWRRHHYHQNRVPCIKGCHVKHKKRNNRILVTDRNRDKWSDLHNTSNKKETLKGVFKDTWSRSRYYIKMKNVDAWNITDSIKEQNTNNRQKLRIIVDSLHDGVNKHPRRGRVIRLRQHQRQERNSEGGAQRQIVKKSMLQQMTNISAWEICDLIKEQNRNYASEK